MAPRLVGLSDEEIERLAKLPRVHKDEMFAERAWHARAPTLRFEHQGTYVVFNCQTLVCTVGKTLNEALDQHYGPTVAPRHFIYQYCKPYD